MSLQAHQKDIQNSHSISCNSPKLESAQVTIHSRMNKQNIVFYRIWLLCCNKDTQVTALCKHRSIS